MDTHGICTGYVRDMYGEFLGLCDGETRRWGDGKADETDSTYRNENDNGFQHRDVISFFVSSFRFEVSGFRF